MVVISFTIEYNTMGIGMLASSSRRMEVSMSTLKQDPFLPKAMPVRKEVRRIVPPLYPRNFSFLSAHLGWASRYQAESLFGRIVDRLCSENFQ